MEGVRNREDAKRMIAEDWKNAQNLRISNSENEDNIKNIKFEFGLRKDSMMAQ
jgi:hypothetical protein